jgi:phosphatidylglycerol:prolipoprotein diacylglycerol transferase
MALEGVALFIAVNVAVWAYRALARPGRASAIFAMGYAASRMAVETVREPDAFLGTFGGFFTMGMILSLPLFAVGVWLWGRSGRTP